MRMRTLLGLLLLCLLPGFALAQEQTINCASGVPCTLSGPQNTGTGDSLQVAFSKVNANTTQLYGMFGVTGLLKGNGAVPAQLTGALAADVAGLFVSCAANPTWALLGGGTCGPLTAGVTNIGITVPAWESVSPGNCSSNCTFAITAAPSQTANQFLATPNGFTGPVGLRAIVAPDIPAINLAVNGNGGVTGVLPVANGGTFGSAATATTNLGAVPQWVHVGAGLTNASFSLGATTNSITLFTLPAGGVVHAIKIKHSVAFGGGSLSAYTISVGISGTLAKLASAFNVFQAASATTFQLSTALDEENESTGTAILATAVSTGGNLNTATAGNVDIWALLSIAQ